MREVHFTPLSWLTSWLHFYVVAGLPEHLFYQTDEMLKRQVRFVIYIAVLFVLTTLTLLSSRYQKTSLTFDRKVLQNNNRGTSSHFRNESNVALPPRVIKRVKMFVFFVGFARSGHSIIASMLDAHPNVVIAHEYSLFSKWLEAPALHSNKTWLFNTLYKNSLYNIAEGLRMKNDRKKGYSLIIPDWWQGKYDRSIHVIGDKAGGMTAQVYRKDHSVFNSTYHKLKRTLKGVPISVIYVLRNPYDNIATMLLYNHHQRKSVNKTDKYVDDDALKSQITSYFNQVRTVTDMIKKFRLNVVEVHNIDMISDPKQTMKKVCSHLLLDCPDDYLHMCAQATYPAESKSRELVQWTAENIRIVAQNVQRFNSLKQYMF